MSCQPQTQNLSERNPMRGLPRALARGDTYLLGLGVVSHYSRGARLRRPLLGSPTAIDDAANADGLSFNLHLSKLSVLDRERCNANGPTAFVKHKNTKGFDECANSLGENRK